MQETGHSKPVHWDSPEGWGGEGGGRGFRMGTHVHLWLIHVDVWQKSPQYCKVASLQFKIDQLKEKRTRLSGKVSIIAKTIFRRRTN